MKHEFLQIRSRYAGCRHPEYSGFLQFRNYLSSFINSPTGIYKSYYLDFT